MSMQALVLAGGFGTRLAQVVPDLPKPMAPVAGRPFMEILLTGLAARGFESVVLSLGYKAEVFERHFGKSFAGMQLLYVVEDQPLGTGGAMRLALQACSADHVYVFNGDTWLALEVAAVEELWQSRREPVLVARAVPDTSRFGRVNTDSSGAFIGFAEKGASGPGLINAGCYVLPRHILDHFPAGQPFSFETDFLTPAAASQNMRVFVTQGHFIDIGVPADYARAQTELASADV